MKYYTISIDWKEIFNNSEPHIFHDRHIHIDNENNQLLADITKTDYTPTNSMQETTLRVLFYLTIFLGFISHANAEDVPGCGNLSNAYGPFNYNTQKNKLGIVEKFHFTSKVENLIAGKSGPIDSDIDYTLRAFPNHHRALFAISRWEGIQKTKNKLYRPKYYSAECYLKRALIFSPDDPTVHILYGMFEHKLHEYEEAKKHYLTAIELSSTFTEAYYNLGLLYYDTDNFTLAEEYAQKAYDLGYPLAGLRNKLIESGHWTRE